MNFVLPQFIDMETKIIGPLTLKQFVYVGSGTAASFLLYLFSTSNQKSFPLYVCLVFVVIIEGAAFSLAFIKVNGISLPIIIKNYFVFSIAPKLYLWKKFETARVVNPNQGLIKIEKAPTSKKANLITKKGELKKLKNLMETKGS